MATRLQAKLKDLPKDPGVYFFKDANKKIIYVGKAAVLKNRVRSYFQKGDRLDYKTKIMVGDIADLDWITVASEIDALFLESEMVKRYKPKYNIDLQDDKHYLYVKITTSIDLDSSVFYTGKKEIFDYVLSNSFFKVCIRAFFMCH